VLRKFRVPEQPPEQVRAIFRICPGRQSGRGSRRTVGIDKFCREFEPVFRRVKRRTKVPASKSPSSKAKTSRGWGFRRRRRGDGDETVPSDSEENDDSDSDGGGSRTSRSKKRRKEKDRLASRSRSRRHHGSDDSTEDEQDDDNHGKRKLSPFKRTFLRGRSPSKKDLDTKKHGKSSSRKARDKSQGSDSGTVTSHGDSSGSDNSRSASPDEKHGGSLRTMRKLLLCLAEEELATTALTTAAWGAARAKMRKSKEAPPLSDKDLFDAAFLTEKDFLKVIPLTHNCFINKGKKY
jgi:hypothetical protein